MKCLSVCRTQNSYAVAPVRERGLKLLAARRRYSACDVAPVRERGLKYCGLVHTLKEMQCRSREGAWIEIRLEAWREAPLFCRSREGAWIEMCSHVAG